MKNKCNWFLCYTTTVLKVGWRKPSACDQYLICRTVKFEDSGTEGLYAPSATESNMEAAIGSGFPCGAFRGALYADFPIFIQHLFI